MVRDRLSPIKARPMANREGRELALATALAGRKPGKMKTGFFWPVYGDRDETAFPFSPSRSYDVVPELLKSYAGVLLTDGYEAYDRYAAHMTKVVQAQCWSHVRRYFVDSESAEPELFENPHVAVDTNHLEREIRPIALGRKNWLFAWTEVGALRFLIIPPLTTPPPLVR